MKFVFTCSKCGTVFELEELNLFFKNESQYMCIECCFKDALKFEEKTKDKRTREELLEEILYLTKSKCEWEDRYVVEKNAHLATLTEVKRTIKELEGKRADEKLYKQAFLEGSKDYLDLLENYEKLRKENKEILNGQRLLTQHFDNELLKDKIKRGF